MIKAPKRIAVSAGPPPEKHWVGTGGASDVETPSFVRALVAAGETIAERGICAFEGEPGLGKTFAALTTAERVSIPFR